MRFQLQKYEKYLNSKNDINKPLGPFNKKLWAIEVFLKSGKISKPSTHSENDIKISSVRSITHREMI